MGRRGESWCYGKERRVLMLWEGEESLDAMGRRGES